LDWLTTGAKRLSRPPNAKPATMPAAIACLGSNSSNGAKIFAPAAL
jgi:hypothetical protein